MQIGFPYIMWKGVGNSLTYASLALVYQERSEVYQQCACINHQKKTLGLSDCPVSAIVKTLKMETNLS